MSDIVIDLLKKAIEDTRVHLGRLEQELADQERARERGQQVSTRGSRSIKRKRRGFREGSVPHVAEAMLQEGQLDGDALAASVSKKIGKEMSARDLRIALSRYITKGIVFQATAEGLYSLKNEKADRRQPNQPL